jgi:hypothetical protein
MSVRPTLLKDLRRTAIQQHKNQTGTGSYNRWDPLSPRGRTFSAGKRPLEPEDVVASAPKTPKLDGNLIFCQLKEQDSLMTQMDSALAELDKPSDAAPDPRFDALANVVKILAKSHKNLYSAFVDYTKLNVSTPTSAPSHPPNKPVPPTKKAGAPGAGGNADSGEKKLKQTLREAEKKTVLFNLNLGKNPAMNKDTLSRKVTEALCTAVKSGKHDYNISDAEEVLDDILSCSKLEFLGTQSKLFFNNRNDKDERNNKMYTLPVRMDFKDRDARFEAEVMLRKLCKVNCSVPYPKNVRQLMSEVVRQGKQLQPDCFIRTKINIDKLQIEASAKTASGWLDLGISKKIPISLLDLNNAVSSQVDMEISSAELPQIS